MRADNLKCSPLVLVIGVVSSPASAYDFYEERGGWEISAGDTACGMSMEYEGPGATVLTLAKFTDDGIAISVTNYRWTAKANEKYDVSYVLNGEVWGGKDSNGHVSGSRRGFSAFFNSGFEKDFAAGASIHIYLGDQKIDQLSLEGTSIALASVNKCLRGLRAEIATEQREKARWEHLPKDPFATESTQNSAGSLAKPPRPLGSYGNWFSYPSEALRFDLEGRSEFSLRIGADGVVKSCEVTVSSGHDVLDAQTCTSAMRRGRFSPATNETGQAIEGVWSSAVSWKLPEPPPPPKPPVTCVAGEVCTRD